MLVQVRDLSLSMSLLRTRAVLNRLFFHPLLTNRTSTRFEQYYAQDGLFSCLFLYKHRQPFDFIVTGAVFLHLSFHRLDAMHDGGVVPAPELLADGWIGLFGQSSCQIHGDLARPHDVAASLSANHLFMGDVVGLFDDGLNESYVDFSRVLFRKVVSQNFLDKFYRCVRTSFEKQVAVNFVQRAFDFSDV